MKSEPKRKSEIMLQWEWQIPEDWSLQTKDLRQSQSKAFDMSNASVKNPLKYRKTKKLESKKRSRDYQLNVPYEAI